MTHELHADLLCRKLGGATAPGTAPAYLTVFNKKATVMGGSGCPGTGVKSQMAMQLSAVLVAENVRLIVPYTMASWVTLRQRGMRKKPMPCARRGEASRVVQGGDYPRMATAAFMELHANTSMQAALLPDCLPVHNGSRRGPCAQGSGL